MSRHLTDDPLTFAPPPTLDERRLAEALVAQWGVTGRLSALGGERDRNFRLDGDDAQVLLVKVAHPDEPADITAFQTAALEHLARTDPTLPVPRLRRTNDDRTEHQLATSDGRTALLRVLTYLPGTPATTRRPAAEMLGALTARLGAAFAGFHHPAATRRLLWDIRELPELRILLPEILDPALRRLTEATVDRFESLDPLGGRPSQVIHNDLNPHNVLLGHAGQPSGIIDFGDMVCAPLAQEVATTCAYLLLPGADPLAAVRDFVTGFGRVLPLPDEDLAELSTLIAARMALTVLITHWRARRQPENAAYILRNMPSARSGLELLADRKG